MKLYLILNGSFLISYIFVRLSFALSPLKNQLSQHQQLMFARNVFGAVFFAFLLMAGVLYFYPGISEQYTFNWLLKSGLSSNITNHSFWPRTVIAHSLSHFYHAPVFQVTSMISVSRIKKSVDIFLMAGILYSLVRYYKNLKIIKAHQQQSLLVHQIKRIKIYYFSSFSDCSDFSENFSPYCWSGILYHHVFLPAPSMGADQAQQNVKLILPHELQHIRQGDTRWSQLFLILKIMCFWNPFVQAWQNLFLRVQEFSCDESVILKHANHSVSYAECLMAFASRQKSHLSLLTTSLGALSIDASPCSLLYRRIHMLFEYQSKRANKFLSVVIYSLLGVTAFSSAYAVNSLSQSKVNIITPSYLEQQYHLASVQPEVLTELNAIRNNNDAKTKIQQGLFRMKSYQSTIQPFLDEGALPRSLLVLPLVESGYQPLLPQQNPVQAAGVWQLIPKTAMQLGLVINNKKDERLDTVLSTKAAISYLASSYYQFRNWTLAMMAYEVGDKNLAALIEKTHSRDPWTIVRSSEAPADLKRFLIQLEMLSLIVNHPELLKSSTD